MPQDTSVVEVRLHGRGGQGAVVASSILATAVFFGDKYVQSFPAFGVERRGAPVAAYVRLSDTPIRLRCAIDQPHHLIVLERNLMFSVNVTQGLRSGGWIVINTSKARFSTPQRGGDREYRYALVDASEIAVRNKLGTKTAPLVNTAMVGAFAKATGLVSLDAVARAIEKLVPTRVEQNLAAAQEAFEQTFAYEESSSPKVTEGVL